jgi:putative addiction module component (TIGR02574 family)
MTDPIKDLEARALRLSPSQRAHLAEVLISSLDEEVEIPEAWKAEIERRLSELRTGSVKAIPAKDVFDELDALIE